MNKLLRNETDMADISFSPEDSRAFRNALGQFATGVTIITTETEDGMMGITANSFTSVSLDPALVLWSVDKAAHRYGPFVNAEHFCINVLTEDQGDIALGFAKEDGAHDMTHASKVDGFWHITGASARFACTRHAVHDGGDHSIILGRVMHVTLGSGAPLVFHSGQFGRLIAG